MASVVVEEMPEAATRQVIVDGLTAFNSRQTGGFYDYVAKPVSLALRNDETGAVEGGLTARIYMRWMFVELLFVPEALRGQGLGEKLMRQAEAVAREAKCVGIWLDTFTFQAPEFYKKLGYQQVGEIADYPPGFSRHFLQKSLS